MSEEEIKAIFLLVGFKPASLDQNTYIKGGMSIHFDGTTQLPYFVEYEEDNLGGWWHTPEQIIEELTKPFSIAQQNITTGG